jgi:hypothetical protein
MSIPPAYRLTIVISHSPYGVRRDGRANNGTRAILDLGEYSLLILSFIGLMTSTKRHPISFNSGGFQRNLLLGSRPDNGGRTLSKRLDGVRVAFHRDEVEPCSTEISRESSECRARFLSFLVLTMRLTVCCLITPAASDGPY